MSKEKGKTPQEFYCNDCDGYFLVYMWLGKKAKYRADIKCPECGRLHPRYIENGRIYEDCKNRNSIARETIHGLKSTYSKEPRHNKSIQSRDGTLLPIGFLLQQERDDKYRAIGEV
jgi:hypothetical protein